MVLFLTDLYGRPLLYQDSSGHLFDPYGDTDLWS